MGSRLGSLWTAMSRRAEPSAPQPPAEEDSTESSRYAYAEFESDVYSGLYYANVHQRPSDLRLSIRERLHGRG